MVLLVLGFKGAAGGDKDPQALCLGQTPSRREPMAAGMGMVPVPGAPHAHTS